MNINNIYIKCNCCNRYETQMFGLSNYKDNKFYCNDCTIYKCPYNLTCILKNIKKYQNGIRNKKNNRIEKNIHIKKTDVRYSLGTEKENKKFQII